MNKNQKINIINKINTFIQLYCKKNNLSTCKIRKRGYDIIEIDFDALNEFDTARLRILGNKESYLKQYHSDYWFAINVIYRLVREHKELVVLNWPAVTRDDLEKINELYTKLI
jgi:hypothetical protein